jgi:hypothetical protein
MMTEGTATPWSLWIESEARPRRRWTHLAAALAIGALMGSALTAVAADRIYDAHHPTEVASVREWPAREIPPEWRYRIRPVPYEHMYRSRR